jgi:glycosyltransferase involved in cell wall biosynthesis
VPAFPLTRLYTPAALVQLVRFAAHLRRLRVQVLHTHDFYTTTFGMAAALLARVPVRVAARRELDVFSPRQRWVEHRAYRAAHVIVANCERLRRELILEGLPAERSVTIPNAVDPRRVTLPADISGEERAAALRLPVGRRFVTTLAHLYNRKKDFETLLSAAAITCRRFPDVDFLVAGDGDPAMLVHRAASLGIGDRVLLLGGSDLIAELLSLSEVGVLSSRSEGLSNSVLEYMAAGLPVVATDVGGMSEAVSDSETGYLVPPGDPVTLADRISMLLLDRPGARGMGREGQRRAHEHFSPEALLRRTSELYERLLSTAYAGGRG